jgi:hypothetical protein
MDEHEDYRRGVRFGCLLGVVASLAMTLCALFGRWLVSR